VPALVTTALQVVITKLKLNKSRKEILERKARKPTDKGKFTEAEVSNLGGVD
jgi:hypothetical protein